MTYRIKELSAAGFVNPGRVHWNLPAPALYEEAVRNREGLISHRGIFVVRTAPYTGRSPSDKYIVDEEGSRDRIAWGEHNRPFGAEEYERLRNRVLAYLQGRDLYVQDVYAGAHPGCRIAVRMVTETAWHAMFARNMFRQEDAPEGRTRFRPQYHLIHVPHFKAIPELDGTRSEVFVILHFGRKEILIGGTAYAGEIKKSVFTLMNYLLPLQGVLSMHCSANFGKTGDDAALFFGLSGTGKTSLSIDPTRTLVGDDEHGWGDDGVFNIEGGCYAKVIRISMEHEPEIYETTRMFGAILENVPIDPETRRIDLHDESITENTRAAFPITHLRNTSPDGVAGHPKVVIFLTADAFGVLPPVARLTEEQAIRYFLLGYTAKVAGTERGIKEPQATFSPCFGAPFMVLPPAAYAAMLGEKIRRHDVRVWLVNTGWTGGGYGTGNRIPLPRTRAMVRAILDGQMEGVPLAEDPVFRLRVPVEVPGVPAELLRPRTTWSDAEAYDRTAERLAHRFRNTFRALMKRNPVDGRVRCAPK